IAVILKADDERWNLNSLQVIPGKCCRYLHIIEKTEAPGTDWQNVLHDLLGTLLFRWICIPDDIGWCCEYRSCEAAASDVRHKPEQQVGFERRVDQEGVPRRSRQGRS